MLIFNMINPRRKVGVNFMYCLILTVKIYFEKKGPESNIIC